MSAKAVRWVPLDRDRCTLYEINKSMFMFNFLCCSVTCKVSGFPLPRWQGRFDSYNPINVVHLVFHRFCHRLDLDWLKPARCISFNSKIHSIRIIMLLSRESSFFRPVYTTPPDYENNPPHVQPDNYKTSLTLPWRAGQDSTQKVCFCDTPS